MDDRKLFGRHWFCDGGLAIPHRMGRAATYLIGLQNAASQMCSGQVNRSTDHDDLARNNRCPSLHRC